MTSVPLGQGAYKRLYSGAPEIRLLNRFLEANPANPDEKTSLLSRPAVRRIADLDPGTWGGPTPLRGSFTLQGLFGDALWVICGQNLYFIDSQTNATKVTGTLPGVLTPEITWQAGAGYQRLWIADGGLLYYYDGDANATGTATFSGSVIPTPTIPPTTPTTIRIGGIYYRFQPTTTQVELGTAAAPFSIYVDASRPNACYQLYLCLSGTGRPGWDYSNIAPKPNPQVTVTINSARTVLTFTASVAGSAGNNIVMTLINGVGLAFSAATLTGGIGSLNNCPMPDASESAYSLTQVSGYVLVSVQDSQKFYWINPGDTTIDPLNFASKESSPDAITSMRTTGDQVLIMGNKSTENWYATGDTTSPFAPIQGRVYDRGSLDGTAVVIDDAVILVGDDGHVYSIGFQSGDTTNAGWGVSRISNNGIEERIRRQLRRELGLIP